MCCTALVECDTYIGLAAASYSLYPFLVFFFLLSKRKKAGVEPVEDASTRLPLVRLSAPNAPTSVESTSYGEAIRRTLQSRDRSRDCKNRRKTEPGS